MVFKCWHIKSGWIFWPVNVHVIFVFIFVFWCCWYEINEPQSTFATLLPEKSNCQFQEQFSLFACLCMTLYVLNMSFMESIIWGWPNCSGMGLYRVDRTTSILCTSFFAGESLLGQLPCFTSSSCTTSLGLFLWC